MTVNKLLFEFNWYSNKYHSPYNFLYVYTTDTRFHPVYSQLTQQ